MLTTNPMDPHLEIRHLPFQALSELTTILESNDRWKTLMAHIPSTLSKDTFRSAIHKSHNPAKYRTEHFRLIEDYAAKHRRNCTEILLDEWGTAGRVRPALGHLLFLLGKAELYRAEYYVAVELLGQAPPTRPLRGPIAPIELNSSELLENQKDPYASDLRRNIDRPSQDKPPVPIIKITESPDVQEPESEPSDMMKFSTVGGDSNIPFSSLFEAVETQPPEAPLNDSLPSFPQSLESFTFDGDAPIPDLSLLNLKNPEEGNPSRRTCASPLPNLSLKTALPHFPYAALEAATNNFDDSPGNSRFLGAGAYGRVYLAPTLLDQAVAVKKLILPNKESIQIDDAVTKQFINEVEVLSKNRHKNLLTLLGYSCDGCTYCLVYEYIPGGTLKDRLQDSVNILSWIERLEIALGTADAIHHLHTAFDLPLIHRDVKTANILLDTDNKPKLGDFGLIKLLTQHKTMTGTTVTGTSAYMPREAFMGDISVKWDTFSFGVVLLELLTSLPPLDDKRENRDLVSHVTETCNGDVKILLDKTAGTWCLNGVDYAEQVINFALLCLEDKKKRPNIDEIRTQLRDIIKEIGQ